MENANQEKMNTSFIINTSIGKGICYVNKNIKKSNYSVKFKINNKIVVIVDAFKIIGEFLGIARENIILYDDNNKYEAVLIREFVWTAKISYNNKDRNIDIKIERFCEIIYKVKEILINYYGISKEKIYQYYYINYNYMLSLYEQDCTSSRYNRAKLFFIYVLQDRLGAESIDEYIKESLEKLSIDRWYKEICVKEEYFYIDKNDTLRRVPAKYISEERIDYIQALKCRVYLHTPIEWVRKLVNTEFNENDLELCFKEIGNFKARRDVVKDRKEYIIATLEKSHYNKDAYEFIYVIFNKLQELIVNIENDIIEEKEMEEEMEEEIDEEMEKEDIKFCKEYYSSWITYITNKK